MNTAGNRVRYDYIDFAKCFGMLVIIWGHIMLSGATNAMAYGFHIPLFFFLSGMVFNKQKHNKFGEFFKNRFKSLLLPYAVYSVATWVVWVVYSYVSHADVNYLAPLLQTLFAQGSGGYLVHNVPLWFVPCLFCTEMIYFFICRLPGAWNLLVCFLLALVGAWSFNQTLIPFDFKELPWSIDVAFVAVFFYALGNLMIDKFGHKRVNDFVLNNKTLNVVFCIIAIIGVYLITDYNGSISMGHETLGKSLIAFYAAALLGIVAMLFVCICSAKILNNNTLSSLGGGYRWFGRNSFDVMAIHNPIKGFVVVVVARILHVSNESVSTSLTYSFVSFVITLAVTVGVVWIITIFRKKYKEVLIKTK